MARVGRPPKPDKVSKVDAQRASREAARDVTLHAEAKNPDLRASCERNLLGFLASYLPARFPLTFSESHLELIRDLERVILDGGQFAVAMPRGSGKTTIFESACLWALLYGHRRFMFVIAADATKAEALMAGIKSELANNDRLDADFGLECGPIRALRGIARRAEGQTWQGKQTLLIWTKDEVRLARFAAGGGCVVRTAGITGAIRGAKAELADGSQVRPDLVLVDDPQTDASAKSPSQVEARLGTLNGTVLGLAGPGQRIACLVTCTVIAPRDVADRILDRKDAPQWHGKRISMLRAWPTASALWDRYVEMRREEQRAELGHEASTAFYAENREAMDAGADHYWPARVDPGDLSALQSAMNALADKGREAFMAEYQNEPAVVSVGGDIEQVSPPVVLRKVTAIPAGEVPDEALELTAGIDVADHCLWWAVGAWGNGLDGDLVAYGAYPDPGRPYFTQRELTGALERAHPLPRIEDRWHAGLTALTAYLFNRQWRRSDGEPVPLSLALVDANYGDSTDTVYTWMSRSPFRDRLRPSHGRGIGVGQKAIAQWQRAPGDRFGHEWTIPRKRERQVQHVTFNANAWKTIVANRLLMSSRGIGIHAGSHRMLGDHLSAEQRIRAIGAGGASCDEWRAIPNRDNHLLDCVVLSAVGANIRGIPVAAANPTRSPAADSRTAATPTDAATEPQPPKPVPKPARRGGWLSGYKVGL